MIENIINVNIIIQTRQSPRIQAYFSQENHCEKKAANIQHKQTFKCDFVFAHLCSVTNIYQKNKAY